MFTHRLYIAEKDEEDYSNTMRRMAIFLKEQLLPVCVKTNALVFLHDKTCSISQTFGHICQAERMKRNGTLPFTVMSIIGADSVCTRAATDEDSVAHQLRRGSRRWKQYNDMMLSVFQQPFSFRNYSADFPDGLTHVILVSSVNEAKKTEEFMPYKTFKSSLIDRLSRDLPSIAVSGYSFGGDPYSLFADYVGRKLPLVLIDARPPPGKAELDAFKASRARSSTHQLQAATLGVNGDLRYDGANQLRILADSIFEEVKWHLEDIERQLEVARTWNFHDASIVSYLHSKIREFSEARISLASRSSESANGKRQWLFMAVAEKLKAAETEGSPAFYAKFQHIGLRSIGFRI